MYLRHFAFTRFPFENSLHADELYASGARREAEARREAAREAINQKHYEKAAEMLAEAYELQQQTMEAADVLYGVTMEPGESSMVLSKRMSRISV